MIFPVDEIRAIRSGKQTATLVRQTQPVDRGGIVRLRKRVDDGGFEDVADPLGDGEAALVVLTIRDVEDLALDQLTRDHARACGLRTRQQLLDQWHEKYPKINQVRFVLFDVGDRREHVRFLRAGAPGPLICTHCKRALADRQNVCKCGHRRPPGRADDSGYTSSRRSAITDAGEALSQSDTERYALLNGQRFVQRVLQEQHRLSTRPLTERLAAIEARAGAVDLRSELRIIAERLERAEKRNRIPPSEAFPEFRG